MNKTKVLYWASEILIFGFWWGLFFAIISNLWLATLGAAICLTAKIITQLAIKVKQ